MPYQAIENHNHYFCVVIWPQIFNFFGVPLIILVMILLFNLRGFGKRKERIVFRGSDFVSLQVIWLERDDRISNDRVSLFSVIQKKMMRLASLWAKARGPSKGYSLFLLHRAWATFLVYGVCLSTIFVLFLFLVRISNLYYFLCIFLFAINLFFFGGTIYDSP